jgi:hypothetical protein
VSRTVTLSDGHTVTLRERDEMSTRQTDLIRDALTAAAEPMSKLPLEAFEVRGEDEDGDKFAERIGTALKGVVMTLDEAAAMTQLRRATVAATLESWSRPEPIPKDPRAALDMILDLPNSVTEDLDRAIGVLDVANAVQVDFGPSTDQDSPTADSGSSNGHSKADPESPLIPTPTDDGGCTATGESTPD